MCGIVVAWDPRGLSDVGLHNELKRIEHRGPDAVGEAWYKDHRLFLGHARLKIIDSSEGANQPFVSPCGRWTLVFNGEIYNHKEIRGEIGDRWPWRTRSDTEVLLAAWSLWGTDSLKRFVGMFAFSIFDTHSDSLIFVRDRFGIKPLYRLKEGDRQIFASEIPPLLNLQRTNSANNATINTYLKLGLYDHSEHTFFSGISSFQPGSLLCIDLKSGKENSFQWYELANHIPDLSRAAPQDILDNVEQLTDQAISSCLQADVQIGLNVSGGVDSSMLVRSTISELGHAHLFTQDYPGYSELPWVKEIAHGGTLHVSELDSNSISSYLSQTIASQAEPFGGITVCGYNALYENARRNGVTVLLDGNGVDEVFLGYKRYHLIYVQESSSEAEKRLRAHKFENFWGHPPNLLLVGTSIDGTNGLCPEVITKSLQAEELIRVPDLSKYGDPVHQAAAGDLLFSKIPRGLRFNDRVSMASSCELRVPFLDHRLVEFAFGIPTPMLLNEKGTKSIFRQMLSKRASNEIAFAKKRSVQSPQREWLAHDWREIVESILNSESFKARGWVDAKKAKEEYRKYLSGDQENSFYIWQWINFLKAIDSSDMMYFL